MDPDQAAQLAGADADAEVAAALAHAVLTSPDLWSQLWRLLDRDSKAAFRGVGSAMRQLVDASVGVVASPSSTGLSDADELAAALRLWPRIRDLTLLNVSNAAATLQPLATAELSRLTKLTVREAPTPGDEAWPMPVLSKPVSASLRVIDVSCCAGLNSIDAVRSCGQLRVLWMPGCVGVPDLSPLAACSETLEELWLADNEQVESLMPLHACTRLRKLDLRDFNMVEDQVTDLQAACTQLADPSSVVIQGLVHELQPNMPRDVQEWE
ncbi:hypothetical protein FOA52_013363 [Chlamydomonas sp. UWO 241]|nr:hypothetical protein FOA52_013363 [Chlamydomonas sp. UWO 241]